METKQELLKQLSEAQGQLEELKKKIENYQEPKFEVGKWYKSKNPAKKTLFVLTKFTEDHGVFKNTDGYGFDFEGDWKGNGFDLFGCDVSLFIPATKEEVEEALIKEAKRRGFKEGVGFKDMCATQSLRNGIFLYECPIHGLCLIDNNKYTGNYIFWGGKWAEIIKEEKIKIGGYEVKVCEGKCGYPTWTEIDGNEFTFAFWEAAKLISEHSKAKIMVGCSKQFDVSLETIEKILKLKNK